MLSLSGVLSSILGVTGLCFRYALDVIKIRDCAENRFKATNACQTIDCLPGN